MKKIFDEMRDIPVEISNLKQKKKLVKSIFAIKE